MGRKEDATMDALAGARDAGSGNGHAVVIGAGLAGLAVARALVAGFERVTIVDRDHLPRGTAHRRGVPQDRHLHLLLPAGVDALEELFPSLVEQLRAGGATTAETDRIRMCLNGHRLAPARTGRRAVFASRPFLEAHVRRRVREAPEIAVRDNVRIARPVTSRGGGRVEGIELASSHRDGTDVLLADLVVDCSGRRSPLPGWLDELGYDPPEVDELDVQVRYATRRYQLPDGVLEGDRHVLVGPTLSGPRGGAMTNVEDGSWIVTLFAMAGERAPTGDDDFDRFAAQLPSGDIHRAITQGRALDDPAPYRFSANRRRRYEHLAEFPEGLLAAGDAVCSFNPIYGQGMSVAAMEARALQEHLRAGNRPASETWFPSIARIIDTPWQLALGADLDLDAVEGHPTVTIRALNRYLDRLQAAAVHDPRLTARLIRVVGLVDPPTRLLSPGTIASVFRGTLRTKRKKRSWS